MPSERTGAVAGVVLAAGTSTRMGHNKLLLELDAETLVHRAVRRVVNAGLDQVFVVLGHEADRVREAIGSLKCQTVFNPNYEAGVNSSLRAGIHAVSESSAQAAVVVLADMPFVTTAMIRTLVNEFRTSDGPLVISDYQGINAPPMLYDRSLFHELAVSEGQGCGKHVVKRHRHEARSVTWPAEALTDLDVPADVERIKASASR
ncbi:MAG TPA: nucleotidyltransferase family protein [Vicinamibacterales bacterium]|jgi:molybdenum cofactor cytidylyltransferase